jgi:uncharacterized protein YcbX
VTPPPPARLAAIAVYPIKACRRIDRVTATLGATGLEGDRQWMVTRPDGRFLSQRTHPALARLAPRPVAGGLELGFPGRAPLAVADPPDGRAREVAVWDDRMRAADAGDVAAAWLSAALGEPVRLVRTSAETRRLADRAWVGEADVPVSFADAYPILVCATASLEALNARLPVPVPMERFRPNLVLAGLAPFAEDGIRTVRVGTVVLRFVKPCTRCTVPSIDQDTGQPSTDPAPALKEFRFDKALRGVTFGVNAVATGPRGAALDVGAPVEVLD